MNIMMILWNFFTYWLIKLILWMNFASSKMGKLEKYSIEA